MLQTLGQKHCTYIVQGDHAARSEDKERGNAPVQRQRQRSPGRAMPRTPSQRLPVDIYVRKDSYILFPKRNIPEHFSMPTELTPPREFLSYSVHTYDRASAFFEEGFLQRWLSMLT